MILFRIVRNQAEVVEWVKEENPGINRVMVLEYAA
jgi:hypothetical protein